MNSYQIGLITQALISVITVTAVFAMTGLAGMFSLGQAAYMAIGAYVTFVLARVLTLPMLVTGVIGISLCIFMAALVGLPTLKLRRDYFALITVGFGQMVIAVILLFERYTGGSIGFSRIPRADYLLWLTVVSTVLIVFAIRNLKYSRFGRMCIALKTDEIAAKSFGIDVFRLKLKVYILASAIAGYAGILMALRNRVITPDSFGWAHSAEMQIFLFFGGTNSLTGATISAFSLKLLPELLRRITLFGTSLQEYRTIIYCILIIIVMNFRPQGLLGDKEVRLPRLFKRNKHTQDERGDHDGR